MEDDPIYIAIPKFCPGGCYYVLTNKLRLVSRPWETLELQQASRCSKCGNETWEPVEIVDGSEI